MRIVCDAATGFGELMLCQVKGIASVLLIFGAGFAVFAAIWLVNEWVKERNEKRAYRPHVKEGGE